ncbi:MAG: hypothetical protein OES09_05520 [Gammaproteobacteria bacterium]|nr:hypothetical protein [Gammaproteobacteria bacterium]
MLIDTTRKLLGESAISHNEIARRTGLKQRWISYFASGHIKKPAAEKLAKLYAFLDANKQKAA